MTSLDAEPTADADLTAAVGVTDDADFGPGGDTVAYRVAVQTTAPLTITAELLHQSLPPAWIDPLRRLDTPAAKAFLEMADARPEIPRVLARASVTEGR